MFNMIALTGRIANDLNLQYIGEDKTPLVNVGFYVQRDYKAKNAQYPESDYFNLKIWRKDAERLAQFSSKGRIITVQGRLKNNNWNDENGKTHHDQEIEVEHWWFADKSPGQKDGQD